MTELVPMLTVDDLESNSGGGRTKRRSVRPSRNRSSGFIGDREFPERSPGALSKRIAINSSAQRRFRSDSHLKRVHQKS
jgi:hypothetical protein